MRTRAFLGMTAALVAPPLLSSGAFVDDSAPPGSAAAPEVARAGTLSGLQELLAYTASPGEGTTFRVADSTQMSMQTPMGPMDFSNLVRTTLTVSFDADPAGFRATAEVTDFSASSRNPQGGMQTMSGGAVEGALVAVVGPSGLVELVDKPDLSREAEQVTLFEELGYDMFPRLPASAVATGDSWTDTVTWSSTAGGERTSSTRIRTFTLGEEIDVEGGSLRIIAVSATVEISSEMDMGGMTLDTRANGTQTGNYYWDAGAGLLRGAELMTDLTGEAKMGGAPPVSVTMKGLQRIGREV